MHEFRKEEYPSPGLTELDIVRLTNNINRLLLPTDISYIGESANNKNDALNQVAQLLLDDSKRDEVTQLIIDKHNRSEVIPDYALYAYWALIQRTSKLAPSAALPPDLVDFTLKLAQEQGDLDIAFKLIMLSSYVGIDELEDDPKEAKKALISIHKSLLETMQQNKINSMDQCIGSAQSSSNLLFTIKSDEHKVDRERLDARKSRPQDLLLDIANNKFMTPEGLAAAKVQQDLDRLKIRDGRPQDLLLDIANNKFMTPEGLAAAKVQQDLDRLAIRTKRFTDLLLDIANNKFMTPEGLAAAKVQQDLDRLDARDGRLQDLRNDLFRGRLLTNVGIQEAKKILGLS